MQQFLIATQRLQKFWTLGLVLIVKEHQKKMLTRSVPCPVIVVIRSLNQKLSPDDCLCSSVRKLCFGWNRWRQGLRTTHSFKETLASVMGTVFLANRGFPTFTSFANSLSLPQGVCVLFADCLCTLELLVWDLAIFLFVHLCACADCAFAKKGWLRIKNVSISSAIPSYPFPAFSSDFSSQYLALKYKIYSASWSVGRFSPLPLCICIIPHGGCNLLAWRVLYDNKILYKKKI